jgi:hypothetical protein
MIFSNFGTLEIENTKTIFTNTCSIDYFLLIIFFCTENCGQIEYRSLLQNFQAEYYKVFLKIHSHIKKNEWNQARFVWAIFNKNKSTLNGNLTSYDFYLTFADSFLNKLHLLQKFSFFCGCSDKLCQKHGNQLKITSHDFGFR